MSISAALVVGALAVAGLTGQERSAESRDEAAIRELVKSYVAAREKSDAAAVGALFTERADQLTSSGEWRRGRDELVRGTLASSKANAGTRTIMLETIRFPKPDVALADGRYTITSPDGATRNMWTSFVLLKTGNAWRIDAIRNMLPAAASSR
jgi:uncharacterized protein (TIGR02246 family)